MSVQVGMGGDAQHDDEGRLIALEFPDFYLVNVYVSLSSTQRATLGFADAFLPSIEARKRLADSHAKQSLQI